MKIAIIGGGIAGIAAAHKLHHSHQVTIFEVAPMLGGHAHGVEVEPGVFADTGVIIYNQGSYPEFIALLKELGTYDSNFRMEMSISFNNIRFKRAMALGKKPFLLAGKLSQLIHPRNLRIFFELWKFYKNGKTYLKEVQGSGIRLETFMNGKKYSPFFLEEFLFPLAMAIWS
ncbi:MAG: NAD(P)-binding protein, partial [Proteobacteria bacterium]|nr:NAD(P)-binding protein [Pseudomonadota bacterium]